MMGMLTSRPKRRWPMMVPAL